jgi:2-phospho-L-lactate guanylyltransferase
MKALLIPVKAFHDSKLRLAPVLPPPQRAQLARHLAAGVIAAADGLPVSVVCDDHDVAAFAEQLGAQVIWSPGLGLSGAVTAGVAELGRTGAELVVVAHADLARPAGLAGLGGPGRLTLVPDRRRDGTNVVVVEPGSGFGFAYGRGSFERHRAEGARLGLEVEVIEHDGLGADIDLPADLELIGR